MADSTGWLREQELRAERDAAYRMARREVIGDGPTPDRSTLTDRQRRILDRWEAAEAAVEAFRAARLAGATNPADHAGE